MSRSKGAGERLQKVLARAGVASRRRVEEMIREGRITVNGRLAELGQRVDLSVDAVKVDGKRVAGHSGEHRYLLLNKPTGCVSTADDPEGRPTVIDLVPARLRKGLVPVGRLDFDTEGLLILTSDGDLAQHVAHPRYGCLKTYEVKVKGRPADAEIDGLREGVMLYGKRTAPVEIESRTAVTGRRASVSNSWWTVTLGEGRTRQIREMFFRIGHPVSRLRRVAIGSVADPRLPRGAWRELTEEEVTALRRRTAKPVARGERPSGKRPAGKRPAARSAGKRTSGRKPSGRKPSTGGKGPRGRRG
ncbi:MAG: rRNA pseudouridine synthase [bacterium]|nr:rRNA pseudouridine synthase [bacterium]